MCSSTPAQEIAAKTKDGWIYPGLNKRVVEEIELDVVMPGKIRCPYDSYAYGFKPFLNLELKKFGYKVENTGDPSGCEFILRSGVWASLRRFLFINWGMIPVLYIDTEGGVYTFVFDDFGVSENYQRKSDRQRMTEAVVTLSHGWVEVIKEGKTPNNFTLIRILENVW